MAAPKVASENLIPIVGPGPLLPSSTPTPPASPNTSHPFGIPGITADEVDAICKLRFLLRTQQNAIRNKVASSSNGGSPNSNGRTSTPSPTAAPSAPQIEIVGDPQTGGASPRKASVIVEGPKGETSPQSGSEKKKGQMHKFKRGMKNLVTTGTTSSSVTKSGSDGSLSVSPSKRKSDAKMMKAHLSSPLTDLEWWWADEKCLLRYLRAREMNIKKAFFMLMKSFQFRRDMKPQLIRPEQVRDINKEGHLYRFGFDKDGRAIIVMWPTAQSIKEKEDDQIRNIVYHLERAIQSMGVDSSVQKQDSIVFMVNYASFKTANQPSMTVTQRFLEIFASHYPERLHKALIIDAPWYFNTFWNLVQPLVPGKTKEKIEFIDSTNPEQVAKVHENIPLHVLSTDMGGPGEYYYDHEAYWGSEAAQYTAFFDFMKEKFNPNRNVPTSMVVAAAPGRGTGGGGPTSQPTSTSSPAASSGLKSSGPGGGDALEPEENSEEMAKLMEEVNEESSSDEDEIQAAKELQEAKEIEEAKGSNSNSDEAPPASVSVQ